METKEERLMMDKIYNKLDEDICKCGHSIHEHEAVHDCKCYVYGCKCEGFEARYRQDGE